MSKVAICICTYNRPQGLSMLLCALEHQRLIRVRNSEVQIVVVDNSPDGSAQALIAAHSKASRFSFVTVHQPERGLSRARNTALAAAHAADFIAFIDDDEVPASGWLQSLYEAITSTDAAAAAGPVKPIFEALPPAWIVRGGFHAKRLPPKNGFVTDAYTCNAIVSRQAIEMAKLRFDEELDEIGGEDTLFFRTLLDAGLRIAWCEKAVVYEWINPQRLKLSWLLRRWYRTGNVEARLGHRSGTGLSIRIANAGRGLARIGAGSLLLLPAIVMSGWRDPSRVVSRLYTVCRGGGLVASSLGRDYREYSARHYR